MFVVEQDKLRPTNHPIFNAVAQLAVLSEVLNGTDHLRSVGVLVVVPGHDLNLIGVVIDLSDHGLGSVEQRAVTHTDDVGGDDLILVVAEGLGSSSLHSSVDGLLGKEDQIARLSAELETTQLQKENLQAAAAASNTADTAASEAAEAEGQYVDGTYDGEADGFGGTIAVEVTVEGGQITDLAITSADGEDSAYLSNAEAIIPKIIEAQSADVDTISGATFSSTGIRNAAQEAIEKAEK